MENKPKILTLGNISQFFDFRNTGSSGIKAGMLIQFRYNSPEGVHDSKPLVYILERKSDRIWGVNFHYQFNLMPLLLELKNDEIQRFLKNNSEYKKYMNELSKPTEEETQSEGLPSVDEMKNNVNKKVEEKTKEPFDMRKLRIPQQVLEFYINDKIIVPKELLRNYLFPRMSNVQKLVYKI